MDKISKAIEQFTRRERDEAEKACKEEKNQVSIDPGSYIAKEIKYQTVLMHRLQEEMFLLRNEIKKARGKRDIEEKLYCHGPIYKGGTLKAAPAVKIPAPPRKSEEPKPLNIVIK